MKGAVAIAVLRVLLFGGGCQCWRPTQLSYAAPAVSALPPRHQFEDFVDGVGIDTSIQSLRMATDFVGRSESLHLAAMDAAQMGFRSQSFDLTICIQNGISAFGVDQKSLFAEAVRVTRSGGVVLFSSYAERFWAERLRWFEIQAEHELIGEIDYGLTGDGVIVCRDGFRATTVDSKGFGSLAAGLGLTPNIIEVDGSSLFCEVVVP
jgi:2-polyprenyl-6-hydroxyphenyl methylase/3-demethylubiquinone-9 3-methyltransferase